MCGGMYKQIKTMIAVPVAMIASATLAQAQLVCGNTTYNNAPRANWVDSVQVNGQCYCKTTFDHNIGDIQPAGFKGLTVFEICEILGPIPAGTQIPYNDIQCGNGPGNDAGDEDQDCCPGRVDQGPSGCQTRGPLWDVSLVLGEDDEKVVRIVKRNATGFALNGGDGASNGQNINLFRSNHPSQNLDWVEIDRGNGFFSYEKVGTNHSIDGGNGGARNQNVHLWQTNSSNFNQHWRKVSSGGGSFRLVKRNATGFALHGGGNGGRNGQNVNLWNSTSTSRNLQWFVNEK